MLGEVNARRARAFLAEHGFGVLATVSARRPGFPFGSIVNSAADDSGRPLFLLSALAVHSKNLAADARASLIVFDEHAAQRDPLASPRLTLIGEIRPIPGNEVEDARAIYLARHPAAREYVGFGDFSFYRMQILDIYFVAGFGAMGWVSVSDYTDVGGNRDA